MDPNSQKLFMGAVGNSVFDFYDPNNIGLEAEGGFFAGLISHTANGVPTHALIVAPRATGATGTGYTLTAMKQWKTSLTTTSGTTSTFDGAANTAAMVTAGIADHPAAQFCVNLSIGGYNDWYLPAYYELDIAYEFFKPSTSSNYTGAGINYYSVPQRTTNRTSSIPTQTSVTVFQSGGGEDFIPDNHWSSTDYAATTSHAVEFFSGSIDNRIKTTEYRVRAFRKVTL